VSPPFSLNLLRFSIDANKITIPFCADSNFIEAAAYSAPRLDPGLDQIPTAKRLKSIQTTTEILGILPAVLESSPISAKSIGGS
jgi:hypothetical protein